MTNKSGKYINVDNDLSIITFDMIEQLNKVSENKSDDENETEVNMELS